jgi:hypothetical protein
LRPKNGRLIKNISPTAQAEDSKKFRPFRLPKSLTLPHCALFYELALE